MVKPDYSPRRKKTVISLLRHARKSSPWWELSEGAKLLYTISAIICNTDGALSRQDIDSAHDDHRLISYARKLMVEAGV